MFLWENIIHKHNNYMIIYPKQKAKKIGQNLLLVTSRRRIIELKLNIMQPRHQQPAAELGGITQIWFLLKVRHKTVQQAALTEGLMQKINFPQVPAFGSWKMLWNIAN